MVAKSRVFCDRQTPITEPTFKFSKLEVILIFERIRIGDDEMGTKAQLACISSWLDRARDTMSR